MATKLKPTRKTTVEEAQHISVSIVKENKDGSADAQVRFNKQGLETLVQWGLVSMLTAAIDAYKPRPDEDGVPVARRIKKTTPPTKKKASKK
jgi:hypothetical protein